MSFQQCVPPCRCQFVQRWLEDHDKYFSNSVSKSKQPDDPESRIANRSFHSQAYSSYQYNEAVQVRSNVVNKLYIQPPYKISPVKPPHPIRNLRND